MSDPLRILWERADLPATALIIGDEVLRWPEGHLAALKRAGVVRAGDLATTVVCDACKDGHLEDVTLIESPPRTGLRAYILCPDAGRVRVPLERLSQHALDFDGIARAVARGMGLAGEVEDVVPGRIWLLGKTTLGGGPREVFMARGLTWPDAASVVGSAARLLGSRGGVVLVPGAVPLATAWSAEAPPTFPLISITSLEGDSLAIDRVFVDSSLAAVRPKTRARVAKPFSPPAGTQWTRDDVAIEMGDLEMTATMRGRLERRRFDEIGFEDLRGKGKPDRLWRLLLRIAHRGGVLRPGDVPDEGRDRTRANLKTTISELGDRLRDAFVLDGNPIPKKEGAYRCQFGIRSSDGVKFPTPAGARWQEVSVVERRDGAIFISVDTTLRMDAYDDSDDDEAGSHIAAERQGAEERAFQMGELGLLTAEGEANAPGRVLLALLRGDGTFKAGQRDESVLKLTKILGSVMEIEELALDYERKALRWKARFSGASEARLDASARPGRLEQLQGDDAGGGRRRSPKSSNHP